VRGSPKVASPRTEIVLSRLQVHYLVFNIYFLDLTRFIDFLPRMVHGCAVSGLVPRESVFLFSSSSFPLLHLPPQKVDVQEPPSNCIGPRG
jgi:hypothetical protein